LQRLGRPLPRALLAILEVFQCDPSDPFQAEISDRIEGLRREFEK